MTMGKRLLLVDDEPSVLAMIEETLQNVMPGLLVDKAANGLEALKLIASQAPDVILSDISMPLMNGIELLKRIKELNLFTPVILMTGAAAFKEVRIAWSLGVFDYFEKPFDQEKLITTINCALSMGESFNRARFESATPAIPQSTFCVRLAPDLRKRVDDHCVKAGISVDAFISDLLTKNT